MLQILNTISVRTFDDSDWITYTAMVLTDVPQTDLTVQHKLRFNTNLMEFAEKFKCITATHIDKLKSDNILHRIAITNNTGEEYVNLVQFDEKQGSKFKTNIYKLILKIKKIVISEPVKTLLN